jgi:hypothetical protein
MNCPLYLQCTLSLDEQQQLRQQSLPLGSLPLPSLPDGKFRRRSLLGSPNNIQGSGILSDMEPVTVFAMAVLAEIG